MQVWSNKNLSYSQNILVVDFTLEKIKQTHIAVHLRVCSGNVYRRSVCVHDFVHLSVGLDVLLSWSFCSFGAIELSAGSGSPGTLCAARCLSEVVLHCRAHLPTSHLKGQPLTPVGEICLQPGRGWCDLKNIIQKRQNGMFFCFFFVKTCLSQVVQKAGGRANEGPAAVILSIAQPLVGMVVPSWSMDQNYIEMFLWIAQPLGQDATVALIHK